MEVYNANSSTLNRLLKNTEFLRLFKQMAFIIHRNTYGGLNLHDLEALDAIKAKLATKLQKDERDYLTKMIDSLSLYDLAAAKDTEIVSKLTDNNFFEYIANQDENDLCEILVEHLPASNALMLSIEINDDALALVTDLVEFTKEGSPDKITNPVVSACNIWDKIRSADDMPNNHINIVFYNKNKERSSFLCFKGLCMAEQYLIENKAKAVVAPPKRQVRKKFKPNFGYGIVALTKKITGMGITSDVMMVTDSKVSVDKNQKTNSPAVSLTKVVAGEVIKKGETPPPSKATSLKGRGYYDMEQGFLFSIT